VNGLGEHSAGARDQGLTLAHFRAQLEDLWDTSLTSELNRAPLGHIAHGRAQLEHLRDTSTGYFGSYGGQSKFELRGKGERKLKLSGNGNECKPLPVTPYAQILHTKIAALAFSAVFTACKDRLSLAFSDSLTTCRLPLSVSKFVLRCFLLPQPTPRASHHQRRG